MSATRILITTICLLSSPVIQGEETEYKTPANMTAEDRTIISEGVADYRSCLSEQMSELDAKIGDPRALTDAAMEQCKPTLAEFDQAMKNQNFDPNFRKHYVESVKNRSAGEALKQAMFMAAQKQAEPDSEGNGNGAE